jgi:aryl-alcohol dehydrogenase-like predicted oxidoreductase
VNSHCTPARLIPGRATPSATRAFCDRQRSDPSHFRAWRDLTLSSIGVGTYLGDDSDETDRAYAASLGRAFERGFNVFDTAINYRNQRAERVIGATLRDAIAAGKIARAEVLVCTKAGYLTGDGARPADTHTYFEETYFKPKIIDRATLVARSHCIAPSYLADQLERSRRNLGLETIDVFYLHNPETQLAEVTRAEFAARMRKAFAFLEGAVAEGKIGWYGTATWEGYRRAPEAADGLRLSELLSIAREVGGADHHFGAIQLPFNLAMPEAYTLVNQDDVSLLVAAQRAGLFVTTSASILQGRLAQLDLEFPGSGLDTSAQHALQLVRSTPGVGTAIVGMRRVEHVEENARLAAVATLAAADVASLIELPA